MTDFPQHLSLQVLNNGLLLVDKPVQWESREVVAALQRATEASRVTCLGHLDAAASGLLLVAFGDAAKLSGAVERGPKRCALCIHPARCRSPCTLHAACDADGPAHAETEYILEREQARIWVGGWGGACAHAAPRPICMAGDRNRQHAPASAKEGWRHRQQVLCVWNARPGPRLPWPNTRRTTVTRPTPRCAAHGGRHTLLAPLCPPSLRLLLQLRRYDGTFYLGLASRSHDVRAEDVVAVPWEHVTGEGGTRPRVVNGGR